VQRIEVNPGDKFGDLTVVREVELWGCHITVPVREMFTAERRLLSSLRIPTLPKSLWVFIVARCGQVEEQFAISRYQVLGHEMGLLLGGLGVDLWIGVVGYRLVSAFFGSEFVCTSSHMEQWASEQLNRGMATIRLESP